MFKFTDAFRKDILTKSEKVRVLKLMLLGIFAALTDVLVVGLVYPFVALLTSSKIESPLQSLFELFYAKTLSQKLLLTCLSLMVGYIFRMFVFFCFRKGVARLRRDIQIRFATLIFDKYLRKNLEFFYSTNSSEIVRNISSVYGYLDVFVFGILTLVSELTLGLGVIGLISVISPKSVLPALLLCGFLGYLAVRVTKSKMKRAGQNVNDAFAGRLRVVQESVGGISEIKLYSKEEFFKEEFLEHQRHAADAESDFEIYSGLTSPLFELVLIFSLIVFSSIYISTNSDLELVLPTLAVLAGAAFRIIPSFGRLINYLQNLDFRGAAAEELRKIAFTDSLLTKDEELNQVRDFRLTDESSLNLVNLGFAYQSTQIPIFTNINMQFEYGKIYCITGESGTGKSTLVGLILGLLKPVEGDVRIGEQSISESLQNWRKTIGYVPQSIFLRDDTIKKNITLGELTEQQVRLDWAIAQSGLKSFISKLPEGIDTIVGEGGARISGGERQRVGIARALYRNPSILVFDEATNALDEETEDQILETIFAMRGDTTIIMLSHNPKVVERCEIVYRLH